MYRDGAPIVDEASPLLLPVAVALLVLSACAALAVWAIPWASIPTPTECHDVVVRSILGRVKSVETVCTTDTSLVTAATFGVALASIGLAALVVVFMLRAMVRR